MREVRQGWAPQVTVLLSKAQAVGGASEVTEQGEFKAINAAEMAGLFQVMTKQLKMKSSF